MLWKSKRATKKEAKRAVVKIYLIEDDAALRSELARVLDFQGYTVEVCTQFARAVTQALDFAPDVVIADLRLP